jgi:hypothetical protein
VCGGCYEDAVGCCYWVSGAIQQWLWVGVEWLLVL